MKYFVFDNIVDATQFDHHGTRLPEGVLLISNHHLGPEIAAGENPYAMMPNGQRVNIGDWVVRWSTGDLTSFSNEAFHTMFDVYETHGDARTANSYQTDVASTGDPVPAEDAIEPVPFVGQQIQRIGGDGEFGTVVSVSDDGQSIGYIFSRSGGAGASVKEFIFHPKGTQECGPQPSSLGGPLSSLERQASSTLLSDGSRLGTKSSDDISTPAPTPVGIDITA